MAHRYHLPPLDGGPFLTDGGLETTLIFHAGRELPAFAAFVLLDDEEGTELLRRYYAPYLALAREHGTGFVFETPTWRASPRWAAELGYDAERLDAANRRAVALVEALRRDAPHATVVSGCLGPQDDAYDPEVRLSADEARRYHAHQVATFADTAADCVTAMTLAYADEAIGIVRAADDAGLPAVLSFTVETDGHLPSGQPLGAAIREVDEATDGTVAYYMVNCAHPTHLEPAFAGADGWEERIRGLRPNASALSHAELDEAEELDEGDPPDLGARTAALAANLPSLTVLGGCCGTDHRHVAAMSDAWRARAEGR